MKKPIIIVAAFLSGILFLVINWLKFANPLKNMKIRKDSKGDGAFWASRIGRYHEGVDLVCQEGETVYSPIDGKITRKAYPYSNDRNYEGCVIFDDKTQTEVKLFYMVTNKVGQVVKQGDEIGKCQAINRKYGGGMINHLHLEIREEGVLINPEEIYFKA
jgi:peptidoglycan LD-endopeptidase LytH